MPEAVSSSTNLPRDPVVPAVNADRQLSTLGELLGQCDDSLMPPTSVRQIDHQLVYVRLGAVSSLFTALRLRHAPTADHALRVALRCSAWGEHLKLENTQLEELEVAALLHDIGKIGVPDAVLRKPSALSPDQTITAQKAREFGLQIVASCVPDSVMQILAYIGAWYNGSREDFEARGDDIPYGARLINIVDAYDAMTTDSVYRKAVSQEAAITELFQLAGTQFDPQLVSLFAAAHADEQITLRGSFNHRWLAALTAESSNELWQLRVPKMPVRRAIEEATAFLGELFRGSRDAIIFLDEQAIISRWNQGAERLTGLTADAVEQRVWQPELLTLRDIDGQLIQSDNCPILKALDQEMSSCLHLMLCRHDAGQVPVDVQIMPVTSNRGRRLGVVVVLRDASNQIDLEARVRSLHEQAMTDPLTGVANRAQFDLAHQEAVRRHLDENLPYSLIICDIDRFKGINDRFGHPAGDAALVRFARILRSSCRAVDLVARYGGEEFVITCERCGMNEASQLAEKIREKLAQTPIEELDGQNITASFGVTELQQGDSAETMLRRADRGLLRAKDTGRDRVVQLGSGMITSKAVFQPETWWSRWTMRRKQGRLVDCRMITNVPLQIAIEKLKGFIADHDAEIVSINGQSILLRVADDKVVQRRRQTDRILSFEMQLDFAELHTSIAPESMAVSTGVHVHIQAIQDRDRRGDPLEAARQLISSLKAYLMAHDFTS